MKRALFNVAYLLFVVCWSDALIHMLTGQGFLWDPVVGTGAPPLAFWRIFLASILAAFAAAFDNRWEKW